MNFHSTPRLAQTIRQGDTIIHLDGEPALVTFAGVTKDAHGYVYSFAFEGDRVPYACRGGEQIIQLYPFPKVGDFATLCFPSDSYPLIVTKVSKSAAKIELARLDFRIVSGSFQGGDAVVEYWFDPKADRTPLEARWSNKTRRYHAGGITVGIGHARYYASPEV